MKKKIKNKKPVKKIKPVKKAKKVIKKVKKVVKKVAKKKAIKTKKVEPVKKVSAAAKKLDNLTRIANELIEKGRKRGFITYDEILKTFPDIENNILFLDELYEKFAIAGIDVLESCMSA
jgi:hypothetical protein